MTGQVREFAHSEPPGGVRGVLRESVFYPCSGLHGRPVELLGRRWQTFIYADYNIGPERLETQCRERGFRGYELDELNFLPWTSLFERPWSAVRQDLGLLTEQWGHPTPEPYIAFSSWNRRVDVSDQHGPLRFALWFVRLEAITAYRELYVRQRIAPRCLVDVCPGLAFGGNYPSYREAMGKALAENRAGLPSFFLHDLDASEFSSLPYRAALKRYEFVGQGGRSAADSRTRSLVLARLNSSKNSCSLQLEPDL